MPKQAKTDSRQRTNNIVTHVDRRPTMKKKEPSEKKEKNSRIPSVNTSQAIVEGRQIIPGETSKTAETREKESSETPARCRHA